MTKNFTLLSFDLEEFDLPKEFNQFIDENEMYEISKQGLKNILNLLAKHKIRATFFITTNFAKKYPELIKQMSKIHEIASHGYSHSDNYLEDISQIKSAKQELEKIIGKSIYGFRAPRFKINNIAGLHELGFEYDSSCHPTIAPGKYLKIKQNRKIHKLGNIVEIPLSTLPIFPFLRAPINWFIFKNFPKAYRKIFAKINFIFSDYLMLIFHSWEFYNISNFRIPSSYKKYSGKTMSDKLNNYLCWLKKINTEFITISDFLKIKNLVPTY